MKKFIIVIISIMLLCGCARVSDASQQVSTETTSEVSGTFSSKLVSNAINSQNNSNLSSSSTTIYREKLDSSNTDDEIKNLHDLGIHQCRLAFDDDIAWELDNLISCNFLFYCNLFVLSGLDHNHDELIFKTDGEENVHYVGNDYTFTYEYIKDKLISTYVKDEANKLLDNSDYSNKIYNYLFYNNSLYIDCSIAQAKNYIDHSFIANDWTYRYDFNYYTFNYTYIDNSTVSIEVFMTDLITRSIVKLPLTAVLEDGKWKLEKMVFEEYVVPAK